MDKIITVWVLLELWIKRRRRKCPRSATIANKVKEKSRECHNHKPQPFPRHHEEEGKSSYTETYFESEHLCEIGYFCLTQSLDVICAYSETNLSNST